MNVRELIEKLQEMDQTARVVVRGYEGGVSDIEGAATVMIAVDVHTEWYYGKHETVEDGCFHDKEYKDAPREKAVQVG